MKTLLKRIPISEFKARCTEELRAVEETGVILEITRHGKIIAKVMQQEEEPPAPKTMADWIGSMRGTVTFSPDYDPHAPAFEDDEWEMNRDTHEG